MPKDVRAKPPDATHSATVFNISQTRTTPVRTSLWIDGKFVQAIVDTGASHSCISSTFWGTIEEKSNEVLNKDEVFTAVDAQGNSVSWLGSVRVELAVPNDPFVTTQVMQVIPGLPYDILLGVNFLARFEAEVNFKSGTLSWLVDEEKGQRTIRTPIYWTTAEKSIKDTQTMRLHAIETSTIGPGLSRFVRCRLQAPGQVEDSLPDTCLGSVKGALSESGAMVMNAVCHATSTSGPRHKSAKRLKGKTYKIVEVGVTNAMANRIRIRAGSVLAIFSLLEEGEAVSLVVDPSTNTPAPEQPVRKDEDEAWRWLQSIPRPHPSRPVVAMLGQSSKDPVSGQSQKTGEGVAYPVGVRDPDLFDLPGIKECDRPRVAKEIRELFTKWVEVFSITDHDYGECTIESLAIELLSDKPTYRKPYNIPFHLRKILHEQLQELLKAGVIEPASSPFSAPIVLVSKKDGSIRLCLDFRMLNAITKRDGYPLPRIDTSLGLLRGAKVFSTMDLVGGYHQVIVNPADREKTAFATPWGQFQYRRAPFGVVNMPALFSRMMNRVFAGMLWVHILIYLDDILCFSETVEEHTLLLEQVFVRLHAAGLKLKGRKCSFYQKSVRYLGHQVTEGGISLDGDKIKAIQEKPSPTSLAELRSDIGLFSYYRMFIKDFSAISEPLTRLLGETPQDKKIKAKINPEEKKKKSKRKFAAWSWGPEQEAAFTTLKDHLCRAPTLVHPDFEKPFIIDCDASQYALGAVCSQLDDLGQEHPVGYASRSLNKTERRYSATKREALGVYWAVHRAFHSYTYGAPFLLRTDHAALTKIFLDGQAPEPIIAGWQLQLSAYSFEIIHRPGADHSNADGLSRPAEKDTSDTGSDVEFPDFLGWLARPPVSKSSRTLRSDTRARLRDNEAAENVVVAVGVEGPAENVVVVEEVEVPAEVVAEEIEPTEPRSSAEMEEFVLGNHRSAPEMEKLSQLQTEDSTISKIKEYLTNPATSTATAETRLEASRCSLIDDLVYVWILDQRSARRQVKVSRIWLPKSLVEWALSACHEGMFAGHLDTVRTFHRVSAVYWWPGIWSDVSHWVTSCFACQEIKTARTQNMVMLHEGFRPVYPFQMVAMDVTQVNYPRGETVYALVFIDLFSRWVEVATTTVPVTAVFVVESFIEHVITRHGTPEFLISDNGPNLTAVLINDACKLLESKRIFVAPYSPQANGVVERFNRTIKSMLIAVIREKRDQWTKFLPDILFAYRTAFHSAIQDTPFFVLYGRDPRQIITPGDRGSLYSNTTGDTRQALLDRMFYARKLVKVNMVKAGIRATQTFNAKCKEVVPYTGLVMHIIDEKKKDMSLPVVARPTWSGPYRVNRQIGPVTYEIQKPGESLIVRAHHRQLKTFVPRDPDELWTHTTLSPVPNPEFFQVKKIIKHRRERDTNQLYFYVSWEGFIAKDNSWETYENLVCSASAMLADYMSKNF